MARHPRQPSVASQEAVLTSLTRLRVAEAECAALRLTRALVEGLVRIPRRAHRSASAELLRRKLARGASHLPVLGVGRQAALSLVVLKKQAVGARLGHLQLTRHGRQLRLKLHLLPLRLHLRLAEHAAHLVELALPHVSGRLRRGQLRARLALLGPREEELVLEPGLVAVQLRHLLKPRAHHEPLLLEDLKPALKRDVFVACGGELVGGRGLARGQGGRVAVDGNHGDVLLEDRVLPRPHRGGLQRLLVLVRDELLRILPLTVSRLEPGAHLVILVLEGGMRLLQRLEAGD
mmetsp:Transcript_38023/g.123257  ORF Transcript_38023/g.123257 Transcript_38023/m.123257 type:complete len:291 (+) Transcript_38023:434-1306(+)